MIPKIIDHNGELFALNATERNQRLAKKSGNKIRRNRLRFRIRFIDNKYCIYKEVKQK